MPLTIEALNDFQDAVLQDFTYQELKNLQAKQVIANNVAKTLATKGYGFIEEAIRTQYLHNSKQAFCNILSLLKNLQTIQDQLTNAGAFEKIKLKVNGLQTLTEIFQNFACLSNESRLQVYDEDTAKFAIDLLTFFREHNDDLNAMVVQLTKFNKDQEASILEHLIENLQKSIESFAQSKNEEIISHDSDTESSIDTGDDFEIAQSENQELVPGTLLFDQNEIAQIKGSIDKLYRNNPHLIFIQELLQQELYEKNHPIPDNIEVDDDVLLTKAYLVDLLSPIPIPEELLEDLFDSWLSVEAGSYDALFKLIESVPETIDKLEKEQSFLELILYIHEQQLEIINKLNDFNLEDVREYKALIRLNNELIERLNSNLSSYESDGILDPEDFDKYNQQIALFANKNRELKVHCKDLIKDRHARKFEEQKKLLIQNSIGYDGIFQKYLSDRKNVNRISWQDWFSLQFAVILGVFNYTPNVTAREEYIRNLETSIVNNLANNNFDPILNEIDTGLKTFSPRFFGLFFQENSLKTCLEKFRIEIVKLQESYNALPTTDLGRDSVAVRADI